MLNKLVQNYLLRTIISSLEGKKRWLVIIVLVVAQFVQSQGVDLADFVADLVNILENAEG